MAYKLIFSLHAITQMSNRAISVNDVRYVLEHGEIIENYPGNVPYPSRLIMGWVGNRPIHVAAADNHVQQQIIIITAYEPDTKLWEADFKKRKK